MNKLFAILYVLTLSIVSANLSNASAGASSLANKENMRPATNAQHKEAAQAELKPNKCASAQLRLKARVVPAALVAHKTQVEAKSKAALQFIEGITPLQQKQKAFTIMPSIKEVHEELPRKPIKIPRALTRENEPAQSAIKTEIQELEHFDKKINALHKVFDIAFKEAQIYLKRSQEINAPKDALNFSDVSKAINCYNECLTIIEHAEKESRESFILRKTNLATFEKEFFAHIIQNIVKIFDALKLSTADFIKAVKTSATTDRFLKTTAWKRFQEDTRILILFVAENHSAVQAAFLAQENNQNIEKIKSAFEFFLNNLYYQIFNQFECNDIVTCSQPGRGLIKYSERGLIQLSQIINLLLSQLQQLAAMNIPLFNQNAHHFLQLLTNIHQKFSKNNTEELAIRKLITDILNCSQALDQSIVPNYERLPFLKRLHETLIDFESGKKRTDLQTPTSKQKDNLSLFLCNNATTLIVNYIERATFSYNGVESQLLFHLLDLIRKNDDQRIPFNPHDRNLINDHYKKMKLYLVNRILSLQSSIRQKEKNEQVWGSYRELVDQIKSLFVQLAQINKKFFDSGLDTHLLKLRPTIEAYEKRADIAINQAMSEKEAAEKEVTESLPKLESHACFNCYLILTCKRVALKAKVKIAESLTGSSLSNTQLAQSFNDAQAKIFNKALQSQLLEIHGFISQAILNFYSHEHTFPAWQQSMQLMDDSLEFLGQIHEQDIQYYLTHPDASEEKAKMFALLNEIKNMLFIFIVRKEQEIKQDLNDKKIDARLIEMEILSFDWARCVYEKLHELLAKMGQKVPTIALQKRVDTLNTAFAKYLQKNPAYQGASDQNSQDGDQDEHDQGDEEQDNHFQESDQEFEEENHDKQRRDRRNSI